MANRPSTIDRLPDEVRAQIAQLRRGGRTIDEIMDHLGQLDVEVSRSALGRHVKSLAEIGEQMRRSETMAKFIVERFGEESDDRVARANMRILQGTVLELLTAERADEDGQPISLTPGEAKELALTLQRLVSAQRLDAERELRLRAEFAKSAASAAEKAMKQQGMGADTIDMVRRAVLGTG